MMGAKTLCKCQIHLLACFALQSVLTGHFGCCGDSDAWHFSVFPLFRHYHKENQTSHQIKVAILTVALCIFYY